MEKSRHFELAADPLPARFRLGRPGCRRPRQCIRERVRDQAHCHRLVSRFERVQQSARVRAQRVLLLVIRVVRSSVRGCALGERGAVDGVRELVEEGM